MIKTTLPAVEKRLDEAAGKLIVTEREIEATIDTSLFAEERWEVNFPHNAKNETLFAYIERVQRSGKVKDRAYVLSNLKALFCFMEGEQITTFKDFCQMFDLADSARLDRLIKKIQFVFELAMSTSAVSPKN